MDGDHLATAMRNPNRKTRCKAHLLVACALYCGIGCSPLGSKGGTDAIQWCALMDTLQRDDSDRLKQIPPLNASIVDHDLDTKTVSGSLIRDTLNLNEAFWHRILYQGLDYSWKKDTSGPNTYKAQGLRSFQRSERAALDTVRAFYELRDSLILLHDREKAPAYLVDAWLPVADSTELSGYRDTARWVYSVLHRKSDLMVIYRNKLEIVSHFYETDSQATHRTWLVHDLVITGISTKGANGQ